MISLLIWTLAMMILSERHLTAIQALSHLTAEATESQLIRVQWLLKGILVVNLVVLAAVFLDPWAKRIGRRSLTLFHLRWGQRGSPACPEGYDSVTGLPSRFQFQVELQEQVDGRSGGSCALLLLDLDQFRYINTVLGHRAGDHFLTSLATVLQGHLGAGRRLYRLGDDEFALILPESNIDLARSVSLLLLEAIRSHSVVYKGRTIGSTASLGIALFPEHGTTAEELFSNADVAMLTAKEQGRNRLCFYRTDQEQRMRMRSKLAWEGQIRDALEKDRLVLYGQPVKDLHQERISHYELLLRMIGDDGEVISPAAFLEVAERFGLIHAIDRWVVKKAIQIAAEQRAAGQEPVLEVNLSGQAFDDDQLLPIIQHELATTGVSPASLIFEITETSAISSLSRAQAFITPLKELGCRFALDDFGVGFSGFHYLRHLPVDYIKIDGSFVESVVHDQANQHLIATFVQAARGLGVQTVAEFVADEETESMVRSYGVDYAQGYHVGRPRPIAAILVDPQPKAAGTGT